jgi:hypothetical protein
MFHVFVIVVILVAVAFVALAVGVFIKGRFPDTHVGHNADMKKLDITCAKNDSTYCQGRTKSDVCKGCGCKSFTSSTFL